MVVSSSSKRRRTDDKKRDLQLLGKALGIAAGSDTIPLTAI